MGERWFGIRRAAKVDRKSARLKARRLFIASHCVAKNIAELTMLICFFTTFFEVSLGYRSSLKVQRTSDYQSKVGFPYTLDRSPEVVDSRRNRNRVPKPYR